MEPSKSPTPGDIQVGKLKLSGRDLDLLLGVYHSRFTTIPHAAHLYFTGPNISKPIDSARKRLKDLAREGLLDIKEKDGQAPYGRARMPNGRTAQVKKIYVFTKAAHDVLSKQAGLLPEVSADLWDTKIRKRLDFANNNITSTVPHELAVFDVQVAFHTTLANHPALVIEEFGVWPLRYQFPSIVRGESITRKPDGFIDLVHLPLRGDEAQHVYFFIEVDRGTEPLHRLVDKMHGYNYHRKEGGFLKWLGAADDAKPKHYPFRVLFVVADKGPTRRDNIKSALAEAGYRSFALCATLEELVSNPLASIWHAPGSAQPVPLLEDVSTVSGTSAENEHATMKKHPTAVS